jgi:hypothetical protein
LENVEKLEVLGNFRRKNWEKGVGRGITRPNGNEALKHFVVVLFVFL